MYIEVTSAILSCRLKETLALEQICESNRIIERNELPNNAGYGDDDDLRKNNDRTVPDRRTMDRTKIKISPVDRG